MKYDAAGVRVTSGPFDIVGAATEEEVISKVRAAYARARVIAGVERVD